MLSFDGDWIIHYEWYVLVFDGDPNRSIEFWLLIGIGTYPFHGVLNLWKVSAGISWGFELMEGELWYLIGTGS